MLDQRGQCRGQPPQVGQGIRNRPAVRPREEDKLLHLDLLRGVRPLRRERRDIHRQRRQQVPHAVGYFHAVHADLRTPAGFQVQRRNYPCLFHDQIQPRGNARRVCRIYKERSCRSRAIRRRHQRPARKEPHQNAVENPLYQRAICKDRRLPFGGG